MLPQHVQCESARRATATGAPEPPGQADPPHFERVQRAVPPHDRRHDDRHDDRETLRTATSLQAFFLREERAVPSPREDYVTRIKSHLVPRSADNIRVATADRQLRAGASDLVRLDRFIQLA